MGVLLRFVSWGTVCAATALLLNSTGPFQGWASARATAATEKKQEKNDSGNSNEVKPGDPIEAENEPVQESADGGAARRAEKPDEHSNSIDAEEHQLGDAADSNAGEDTAASAHGKGSAGRRIEQTSSGRGGGQD